MTAHMDASVLIILETFFGKYTRLKYNKGEIILRAGDTPLGVFYLKKGYVRQYMVDESGTTFMLHIFKPTAFFPMTWVVNNETNRYYLEAVTPIEVWRAPKDAVRKFLYDYPAVVHDLTHRLLLGISGMRHRMYYLVMGSACRKTILLLLYLADSFGEKDGSSIVLPVPVTHREIAAWIGTTRETASLQVGILKNRGLILYRRRQLIIPSVTMLEEEIARQGN
jgi:CRP/FNR family transcriptional regulator